MINSIGLASYYADSEGDFILTPLPDSQIRENVRRVERRKTLDGGVVITDGGFSHGDRTLKIKILSLQALWDALWSMFVSESLLTVSIDDGCFLCVMESISENNGIILMSILITEKISA